MALGSHLTIWTGVLVLHSTQFSGLWLDILGFLLWEAFLGDLAFRIYGAAARYFVKRPAGAPAPPYPRASHYSKWPGHLTSFKVSSLLCGLLRRIRCCRLLHRLSPHTEELWVACKLGRLYQFAGNLHYHECHGPQSSELLNCKTRISRGVC
jgi:hypothetical protein